MVISIVKDELNVNNVRAIILKISWHTHLKHSKAYIFILQ